MCEVIQVEFLIEGIIIVLTIYSWMIAACILLSWLPELQNNEIARFLSRAVDPFLAMFRKIIPSFGGIDITGILVIGLLRIAIAGLSSW